MNEPPEAKADYALAPAADFVLPFSLRSIGMRGQLVRLDAVSTRSLTAHPLPEPCERVLAETVALAAILGSALKLEGRLSVQTRSNGPLSLVFADYFGGGGLRGYAKLNEEAFAKLDDKTDFAKLAGEGALAITIEPTRGATAYQGLVSMSPKGLGASAEIYFEQSEQLPTLVKVVAGQIHRAGERPGWRAGGLMVQALPQEGDIRDGDDWNRVKLFLDSLEAYELLDTDISAESVLWRLFHEDEVRVHAVQKLHFECTCSKDKVVPVLKAYAEDVLRDLADPDGVIRTRCEFCGTGYEITVAELVKA